MSNFLAILDHEGFFSVWEYLNENIVFIGEIGLAGEVRSISRLGDRLSEVEALGFNGAVVPEASMNDKMKKSNLKIYPVTSVKQTFDILFWNTQLII